MPKQVKLTICDFLYKPLLYLVTIQIAIVLFFSLAYHENTNVSRYIDCEHDTITVEDKYIVTHNFVNHHSSYFFVKAQGEEYQFDTANYSTSDLDEMISIGERIDVFYLEDSSLSENDCYYVVDARTQDKVYVNIDDYNEGLKDSNVWCIISFFIFEAIFIFILIAVFFDVTEFRIFVKNLKRKIKKIKKMEKDASTATKNK